jgi:hypothetical protein
MLSTAHFPGRSSAVILYVVLCNPVTRDATALAACLSYFCPITAWQTTNPGQRASNDSASPSTGQT